MAQFLVDASLPRLTAEVLRRYGHFAIDVREIGLGDADDSTIAGHAQSEKLAIIARDDDFANIREYPPGQFAGIVIIRAPDNAKRELVLRMVEHFLSDLKAMPILDGRLFLVEPGRVRIREG